MTYTEVIELSGEWLCVSVLCGKCNNPWSECLVKEQEGGKSDGNPV